jgi:hypothetical protein
MRHQSTVFIKLNKLRRHARVLLRQTSGIKPLGLVLSDGHAPGLRQVKGD